jgi:dihydroflavonol-4-reductase
MKRALVTGATGFVGANLVRTLIERGFRVRVVVRSQSSRKVLDGLDIEYARGDVLDRESLAGAMRACDAVFHTAAYVSMFVPDPEEMWRVNVGGTRNVLSAAREAGVPRVVLTSTVSAVAGSFDPEAIANEETPFNLGRRGFHYCITKHAAEEEAKKAVAAGQDVVIVNPSSMFGEYDVRPNIGRMIVAVVKGQVPAYTHGGSNYVDVRDVCDGHILAYEKGRTGERYILANENLTHKEVFERIQKLVGGKAPGFRVPYPLAWLGGLGGEITGRLTGNEPQLDLTVARMSRYYFYFTYAKAQAELGFNPGSLDEAIVRAHRWLQDNGRLA